MDEHQSLSHTVWDCKYHIVFIPKCRRKTLYLELRKHLGEVFRKLAAQKEAKIEEGHLMPHHVHMMISIPPKIFGVAGGRLDQGKERDPLGAGLRGKEAETSWADTSGRAASSSTRRDGPRRQSAPTSATRRRRIRDWTNSISGVDPATFRWPKFQGAASATPFPSPRAAPILKPPALPGDTYRMMCVERRR
jgi:Transposase IS200 like